MNEIDWGKAPEDADKYNTHNSMFYKGERPYLQVFIHEQWKPSVIIKSNELFVYRPATPSWSGEGRPPVGVECEFRHKGTRGEWVKCHVVGYHLGHLYGYSPEHEWFMRKHDGVCHLRLDDSVKFRPIRTPEQIAADEREAAIDAMLAATPAPVSDISLRVCEQLYDAGYRKP